MENNYVEIIAEAGVNHNGDLGLAMKLAETALKAGADYVKFQSFTAEAICSPTAPKSTYHIETTGSKQSWYELLKSQELSAHQHEKLIEHCNKIGIKFLSTPYDVVSAKMLADMGVSKFKIASTDAMNFLLLEKVFSYELPVILSTAMCTESEVTKLVEFSSSFLAKKDLTLMQCTGSYPAKLSDLNLAVISEYKRKYEDYCNIGFSDHSLSSDASGVAAVALGAKTIEKHFTLDKNMDGPDHRMSLEPNELAAYIESIKSTSKMLGNSTKRVLDCEVENRSKLRKGVHLKSNIDKGGEVHNSDYTIMRPPSDFCPSNLFTEKKLIAKKTLSSGSVLKAGDVEFE